MLPLRLDRAPGRARRIRRLLVDVLTRPARPFHALEAHPRRLDTRGRAIKRCRVATRQVSCEKQSVVASTPLPLQAQRRPARVGKFLLGVGKNS